GGALGPAARTRPAARSVAGDEGARVRREPRSHRGGVLGHGCGGLRPRRPPRVGAEPHGGGVPVRARSPSPARPHPSRARARTVVADRQSPALSYLARPASDLLRVTSSRISGASASAPRSDITTV